MNCPVWIPSAAMKSSVLFLKRYGSRKATLARGAPRPGSWMISWEGRPPEQKDVSLGAYQPTHGLRSAPRRRLTYLYNPLDVAMAFSEVNVAEFSSTFSVLDVGFEHGARTFSLSPDHTSHRVLKHSTVSVIYRSDKWRLTSQASDWCFTRQVSAPVLTESQSRVGDLTNHVVNELLQSLERGHSLAKSSELLT